MKKQLFGVALIGLAVSANAAVKFDDPAQMDEWGLYGTGIVAPDAPAAGGSSVTKFDDTSIYFGFGVKAGDASWNVADMVDATENTWHVKLHTEAFRNPGTANPDAYSGLWFIANGKNFAEAQAAGMAETDKLNVGIAANGKLQIRLKVVGDGDSDGPPTVNYAGTGAAESKTYDWTSFKRANWGGKTTFTGADVPNVLAIGFVKVVAGAANATNATFPAASKVDLELKLSCVSTGPCSAPKTGIVTPTLSTVNGLELVQNGNTFELANAAGHATSLEVVNSLGQVVAQGVSSVTVNTVDQGVLFVRATVDGQSFVKNFVN